jgi:hypothetical protein
MALWKLSKIVFSTQTLEKTMKISKNFYKNLTNTMTIGGNHDIIDPATIERTFSNHYLFRSYSHEWGIHYLYASEMKLLQFSGPHPF